MSTAGLRNIGPKSAAWLRQVGLHQSEDLVAAGAVQAFLKVRRAGFKPSLNLLYALEGALLDCHWHDVPTERRQQLQAELEAASAALPPPRGRPLGKLHGASVDVNREGANHGARLRGSGVHEPLGPS